MIEVYDVVDVLAKMNYSIPGINFVTEDRIIKGITNHVFFLQMLDGQEFEPPIKTSISMRLNQNISADEYALIREKIRVSFKR